LVVVMNAVYRVARLDHDRSQSHHECGQVGSGRWEQGSEIFCGPSLHRGGDLFTSATKSALLFFAIHTWRTAAVAVWVGAPVVIPIAIRSAWSS
jgi:hypothetical protein